MRRRGILSVLMIPLLLLAGCGEREARLEKSFESFRESVIAASDVSLRADITADYGESVEHYVVAASYDGSETALEVLEPALIGGVRVTARWGDTELAYGDVMLGMGPLDEDGDTPVSAVPVMLEAMAGGHVELLWWDGEYIAARIYTGESSRCTVWLDAGSLTPVHAEIASDGRTVVSCELTDWTMAGG